MRTESKSLTKTGPSLSLIFDATAQSLMRLVRADQCEVIEKPIYEEVVRRSYCKVEGDDSGCTVPCEGAVVAAHCTSGPDMQRWTAYIDYLQKNTLPYRRVQFREEEIKTGRLIEGNWTTRQILCPTGPVTPWAEKRASITLHDMNSGRDTWRWEGITGAQGELPLSRMDYKQLLEALDLTTQGKFILTSERLHSEFPLSMILGSNAQEAERQKANEKVQESKTKWTDKFLERVKKAWEETFDPGRFR